MKKQDLARMRTILRLWGASFSNLPAASFFSHFVDFTDDELDGAFAITARKFGRDGDADTCAKYSCGILHRNRDAANVLQQALEEMRGRQ